MEPAKNGTEHTDAGDAADKKLYLDDVTGEMVSKK